MDINKVGLVYQPSKLDYHHRGPGGQLFRMNNLINVRNSIASLQPCTHLYMGLGIQHIFSCLMLQMCWAKMFTQLL